jgi:putative glycerol-1-phosphate prenyltransferase
MNKSKEKKIAILIDPDKIDSINFLNFIEKANKLNVDYFFVGGSLVNNSIENIIDIIKNNSEIPVIIFPGNTNQITKNADGILFLSLISGRNPEYLISNHVISAIKIKQSGIKVYPTGYILIESGTKTSVEYISNTTPIPNNKPEIVLSTAIAGELLGLSSIYLEAGSGAKQTVAPSTIQLVRDNISCNLIVGGGIKTAEQLLHTYKAGANIAVIGTSLEQNLNLLDEFISVRNSINSTI